MLEIRKSANKKRLNNEIDLLKFNLCTMCNTDDLRDLRELQRWAHVRIDRIYEINSSRIMLEEENNGSISN